MSEELEQRIHNLEFVYNQQFANNSYDVPRQATLSKPLEDLLKETLQKEVARLDGYLDLSHLMQQYHFSAHKMVKGDSFEMHTEARDTARGFPDILLWFCKNEEYVGREFMYGTRGNLSEVQPETGLCCLVDTIDPNYIHGVKKLQSNTEVITITGTFDE